MLLLKMLLELNLSGCKSKIVSVASNKFGTRLAHSCRRFNIDYSWFANDTEGSMPLNALSAFCCQEFYKYEAIIVGELEDEKCYIGRSNAVLTTDTLLNSN